MKNKLTISAIVVLLAIGGYAITSNKIGKATDQYISDMIEQLSPYGKVEKETTKNGLFKSEYKLNFTLNEMGLAMLGTQEVLDKYGIVKDGKIQAEIEVEHGPIVFVDNKPRLATKVDLEFPTAIEGLKDTQIIHSLSQITEVKLPEKMKTVVVYNPYGKGKEFPILTLNTRELEDEVLKVDDVKVSMYMNNQTETYIDLAVKEVKEIGKDVGVSLKDLYSNIKLEQVNSGNKEIEVKNYLDVKSKSGFSLYNNGTLLTQPVIDFNTNYNKGEFEVKLNKVEQNPSSIKLQHTISIDRPYIPYGRMEFLFAFQERNFDVIGEILSEITLNKKEIKAFLEKRAESLKSKSEAFSQQEIKIDDTMKWLDEITSKKLKLQKTNSNSIEEIARKISDMPEFKQFIAEFAHEKEELDKAEYAEIISFYTSMLKTDSELKQEEVVKEILSTGLFNLTGEKEEKAKEIISTLIEKTFAYDPKKVFENQEIELYEKQAEDVYKLKLMKESQRLEFKLNDKYPLNLQQLIYFGSSFFE